MIDNGYYYVDKTKFIERVLNEKVVFYRSPTKFGKTLNMSMLYYFFSNKEKENAYLFNELNISKNKEVLKHQNQYPVVFVSLKEMNETTMENQIKKFSSIISHIIGYFKEILDNDIFDIVTKQYINKYYLNQASKFELEWSLLNISRYLNKYYQKKVIILIDEYDVPLQAAYQGDFYDEMVNFLGSVFSSSLKTNDALKAGILTGCLRFSKESIIIGGFNNFVSYSMLDNINDAFFGFTKEEIVKILNDYKLSNSIDEIKEWYDGYIFGKIEAFNPWSTLKYIQHKIDDLNFKPVPFLKDAFCNNLIMKYLQTGDGSFRKNIDLLIHQNALDEIITSELIYSEIDKIINAYSFLFLTGYLKIVKKIDCWKYKVAIPNKEVYELFKQSYLSYFEKYKFERKNNFYQCLINCDVDQANEILGNIFSKKPNPR